MYNYNPLGAIDLPKRPKVGDSVGKAVFAGYGRKTSSHRKTIGHRKNKRGINDE